MAEAWPAEEIKMKDSINEDQQLGKTAKNKTKKARAVPVASSGGDGGGGDKHPDKKERGRPTGNFFRKREFPKAVLSK